RAVLRALGREPRRERGAQVVMDRLEPAEPHVLLRAVDVRATAIGELQEPREVARERRPRLPRRVESLARVLPNDLQHTVPRARAESPRAGGRATRPTPRCATSG